MMRLNNAPWIGYYPPWNDTYVCWIGLIVLHLLFNTDQPDVSGKPTNMIFALLVLCPLATGNCIAQRYHFISIIWQWLLAIMLFKFVWITFASLLKMHTCDNGLCRVRSGTGKQFPGLLPSSLIFDYVSCDPGTGGLPSEQQGVASGCDKAEVGRRIDG